MREKQRRVVCKRLEVIEEDLATQLLESYAGRGPIEFWTAVERFKLFVEMRKATEVCGYKTGAVKRALEETMKKFSTPGKVDREAIRGALKSTWTDSVQLQHRTWSKLD